MNSQEEKLSLLSELIELSKADGYIAAEEIQFIHTIAEMFGIGEYETAKLFKIPAPFVPPESEYERILQFHRMVLLMNVDYEVHDKEIDKIKKLGLRLGLAPAAILEVLKEMKTHEDHVIPPEELLQIFTKYHN